MGELVSVKTLTKIIERDKKAGALCAECAGEENDDMHDEWCGDEACCSSDLFHPFLPYLSRAAKDRRILIRCLNNIAEEWGQHEAASKIDRMLLNLVLPAMKTDCD
jgi:hypothetical protein